MIKYKFSILLAGFIVLLSLVPSSSMPDSPLFSIGSLDKLVHFAMYGAVGMVALLEKRSHQHVNPSHLLLMGAIFLMSVLIEFLQATVVASRSAEWLDLLANLIGLMAGFMAYRIMRAFIS